jgi:hypothetical protein
MVLYTNGVQQISRGAGGTINTTGDPLYIATKNSGAPTGDRFNGRLDDVRIYNRALSASEVAVISTNMRPGFLIEMNDSAVAGQPYSGSIVNVFDPENDPLTFSKVSGPNWLNVASSGALSGMPLSANVGTNSFVVRVTDTGGLFGDAPLSINVAPAPPIFASIAAGDTNLLLNWSGGISPYQVQTTTNLAGGSWQNIGGVTAGTSLDIPAPTNTPSFYRVLGQ